MYVYVLRSIQKKNENKDFRMEFKNFNLHYGNITKIDVCT